MTTTVANQQPRINLANGGSMQSAQVVTLKSGQQNASSVDSKSPMHSFELRTSSTLPRCSRVASNPEYETLNYKISARIARKKDIVFLREDFADLGGYDQVGRILRNLVRDGKIVEIGYGLYAKAKRSSITGEVIPVAPLPTLAKAALERLGVEV